jgi:hypothetical protein
VSSVDFEFKTAPINSEAFYADIESSGAAVKLSLDGSSTTVTPYLETVRGGVSRFFALQTTLNGSPSSDTTVVATIDVVVRG